MPAEKICAKRAFFRIYPSIVFPLFIGIGEQTIMAAALPIVVISLGGAERISWVMLAYLAANTIGAPIHGVLGDEFGRRNMLMAGLVVYIASAFACLFAKSVESLAVLRVLQGLGGVGLSTASLGLLGDHLTPRDRGRFEGYIVIVILSAASLSPMLGGFLATHFGWQSIFVYGAGMGVLALLLALRLPAQARKANLPPINFRGMLLFSIFVGSLLLAFEKLRPPLTDTALSLALMAGAAVAFAAFLWTERRASAPFMNPGLWGNPVVWRANALGAFHGAAALSLIVTLPLLMRIGKGWDVLYGGLLLVVMNFGSAIGSVIVGRFIARTGRILLLPTIAMALCCVLFFYLGLRSVDAGLLEFAVVLSLIGLCLGTTMGPVQMAAQHAAGRDLIGAATGLVVFSRSMGSSMGLTATTATLFTVLALVSPHALGQFEGLVREGPQVLSALPDEVRTPVLAAVSASIGGVFFVIAGFCGLAALFAGSNPIKRL